MFKNEDFKIAYMHLEKSINESEEAIKEILNIVNRAFENLKDDKKQDIKELQKELKEIVSLLQFQDILAQRIKKVEDFLKIVDKRVDSTVKGKELDEFAWENEVNQENIDDILKRHGM